MSELTTVDFRGAKILAVVGEAGNADTVLVPIKQLSEGMGLDWTGQFKRLKKNPTLSKGMALTPIPSDGGVQLAVTLPLNRIHFWMATISTLRIADPEIRARIQVYQEECADVLYQHFSKTAAQEKPAFIPPGFDEYVKRIVVEALADKFDEAKAIAGGHDARRSSTLDFLPMLHYLISVGVIDTRGRTRFSSRCSGLLNKYAKRNRRDHQSKLDYNGKYIFHVDLWRDWYEEEGKSIVRTHREKTMGQTVMPFPDSKKPDRA